MGCKICGGKVKKDGLCVDCFNIRELEKESGETINQLEQRKYVMLTHLEVVGLILLFALIYGLTILFMAKERCLA